MADDTAPPAVPEPIPDTPAPEPAPETPFPEVQPLPAQTQPTPTAEPELMPVEAENAPKTVEASESQTTQIPANESFAPLTSPQTNASAQRLVLAHAAKQKRRQQKLDMILAFLAMNGKVTNDEVQKLLRISHATATRYLTILKKEGKIRQVGKTGKAVVYVRT